MNTVFHIGWSKTGTSSFQKWLLRNEEKLYEKGVLFPKTGRWEEGSHHELALSLCPITGYQSKQDAQTLWKELVSEIKECRKNRTIRTVIITSELLPPLYEYPQILRLFKKAGSELSILAVVREQVSLVQSLQHQLVADAAVHLTWNVWELFKDHKENFLYYEKLKKYEGAHNWQEFNILPYDSNNIVSNLAKTLGWADLVDKVPYENISQPYEVIEVLRHINTVEMSGQLRMKVNNKIKDVLKTMELKSNTVELSDAEIKGIKDYYKESNDKLAEFYGIRF